MEREEGLIFGKSVEYECSMMCCMMMVMSLLTSKRGK